MLASRYVDFQRQEKNRKELGGIKVEKNWRNDIACFIAAHSPQKVDSGVYNVARRKAQNRDERDAVLSVEGKEEECHAGRNGQPYDDSRVRCAAVICRPARAVEQAAKHRACDKRRCTECGAFFVLHEADGGNHQHLKDRADCVDARRERRSPERIVRRGNGRPYHGRNHNQQEQRKSPRLKAERVFFQHELFSVVIFPPPADIIFVHIVRNVYTLRYASSVILQNRLRDENISIHIDT